MTQLGTKKSRNGCTHCKRRRVKCDEGIPCGNCTRRNEECSLLFSPSPGASPGSTHNPPKQDTSEWLQDLELMHHYSTQTYDFGFNRRPHVAALWRDNVPRLAVDYPYVMHGLLAYAALHLASDRPTQAAKYQQLCDKHQALAIAQFRESLSSIDSNNADAMFALAAMFSSISIARMTVINSTDPNGVEYHTVDDLAEVFILTRGVRDVVAQGYEWIHAGPFSANMHGYGTPEHARIPIAAAKQLTHLADLFALVCDDTKTYDVCIEATNNLCEIYATVATHDAAEVETGLLMRYPTMLQSDFVKLIQTHHPAALVILAHYVMLFALGKEAWYVQNLSGRAMLGIQTALQERWQPWLEWPKIQLANGLPVFSGEMEAFHGSRKKLPYAPLLQAKGSEWVEKHRNQSITTSIRIQQTTGILGN